jgi:hypothetical protein
MSRPKEINREEIKDCKFVIRCTKKQLELINKKAKKLNLSASAYVRMSSLGDFTISMTNLLNNQL